MKGQEIDGLLSGQGCHKSAGLFQIGLIRINPLYQGKANIDLGAGFSQGLEIGENPFIGDTSKTSMTLGIHDLQIIQKQLRVLSDT